MEEKDSKSEKRFPSRCNTPLKPGYSPEMDDSCDLKADGLQYYQELVGVLRWMVELGRVDILLETSLMPSHLSLPRLGHLEQLIHIFGYLKAHSKRKLAFDAAHPNIDEKRFKKYDWYDFYCRAKEAIPTNCLKSLGNSMSTYCFVDADLAGNLISRRSQTGVLIFCNRAPVIWHSKRQNLVESSTCGSEIMALKNAIELIEALRYKLRMFKVTIGDRPISSATTNPSTRIFQSHKQH